MKFKTYALQDLVTIKYGKNQKNVLSETGTVPIYGTGGLMAYATEPLYDKPSVLIGRKGTIGKVKYVDHPFWTVDTLFYTIVNEKIVIPKYLYYLMSLIDLNAYNEGTTIPSLRTETLNRIEFEIPSIEEQEIILSYLAPIDEKVYYNNKINNNLEQQAIALFKDWFVDFHPFDGQRPSNWSEMSLDQITSLVSRGITPKYTDDSDQIVLNQKCIRDHTIDLTPARKHIPKTITEKWLRFGDLLINSTGTGTLGRTAQVLFTPNNMTVDSHVTIVRPSDNQYIYFVGLWGITHEAEIESLHTGSTGQTELSRERVKSMRLLVPDDATLKKFNTLVSSLFELSINNQKETLRLASIRDIVLPRLISGKLDVSELKL